MNTDTLRGATRSKTMWLASALIVAGAVQANIDVFRTFLTPEQQGLLTMAVGITVALLRLWTDKPLEQK